MRKSVTFGLFVFLVSGCATPAPNARWEKTGSLSVPLASSWPPTVRVTVEGAKEKLFARLMLDTGAEESALDERIVSRLDLGRTWKLESVQGLDEGQGGVGQKTVFQRKVPALDLAGACRLEELRVVPLPMPASRDGVLALAAFPGRAVVLDPVRSELRFVPRASVPALCAQEGAIVLPVRREGNLLLARVELRGNAGPSVLEMVLDTGAQDSFLTEEALADMHAAKPASDELWLGVKIGSLAAGNHSFRVERGGSFCTLGGDVLLNLGRPILFDLEDEKVVVLRAGSRS